MDEARQRICKFYRTSRIKTRVLLPQLTSSSNYSCTENTEVLSTHLIVYVPYMLLNTCIGTSYY